MYTNASELVRIAAPVRFQVEEMLRRAIADGAFEPGTRLIERELCARFGVSRPLMREALRQLEAEQLVETMPSRGMFVAKPTLEDALELYQVRTELEGLAARIVAERGSDEDISRLRTAVESLEAVVDGGDPDLIRLRKNAFYEVLIEASGNRVLRQVLQVLHNRIQLFRGAALAEPGRARAATAELRAIFEAIRVRDSRQAQLRTNRHLRNAGRVLAKALAHGEERRQHQLVGASAGAPDQSSNRVKLTGREA
jgi:GntR family transcriptional regulator, trigonelline degradation regulator